MISTLEFLRRVPNCPICLSEIIWKENGAYGCANPHCSRIEYNLKDIFRGCPETMTNILLGDVMYRYVHKLQSISYHHITDKNRTLMRYCQLNENAFFTYLNVPSNLIYDFPMNGAFVPVIERYISPFPKHKCNNISINKLGMHFDWRVSYI